MPSRTCRSVVIAIAAAAILFLSAVPALAHGFSSTVYVDVSSSDDGHVRTKLELEYDLYVVSTADYEDSDPLFRAGTAAFDNGDTAGQKAALDTYADPAVRYVTKRFSVTSDGATCTPTRA